MKPPLTPKQICALAPDVFGAVHIEVREAARQLRKESALLQARAAAMTRCERRMATEAKRRLGGA